MEDLSNKYSAIALEYNRYLNKRASRNYYYRTKIERGEITQEITQDKKYTIYISENQGKKIKYVCLQDADYFFKLCHIVEGVHLTLKKTKASVTKNGYLIPATLIEDLYDKCSCKFNRRDESNRKNKKCRLSPRSDLSDESESEIETINENNANEQNISNTKELNLAQNNTNNLDINLTKDQNPEENNHINLTKDQNPEENNLSPKIISKPYPQVSLIDKPILKFYYKHKNVQISIDGAFSEGQVIQTIENIITILK